MLRVLVTGLTIVAAFHTPPALAAEVSENVPLPGGVAALARTLGFDVVPERARFITEVIRVVHDVPEGRRQDVNTPLHRLLMTLDVARQFRETLAAAESGKGGISLAATPADRLSTFFQVAGVRLQRTRTSASVERGTDRDARARVAVLESLGVDMTAVMTGLNAGDLVHPLLPTEEVPVPLTAATWRQVFLGQVAPADLVAGILSDKQLSLLCYGLAGLDDETLEFLTSKPAILKALRLDAALLAGFGSHLRVRGNRVEVPGGDVAVPLWEAMLKQPVTRPDRFVPALLTVAEGRLAYLYDMIGGLDPAHRAFVLGGWMPGAQERVDRFRALTIALTLGLKEWSPRQRPFVRPPHDLAMVAMQIGVSPDGAPLAPAGRRFWAQVFESTDLAGTSGRELRPDERLERSERIDAAWLADQVCAQAGDRRATRFEQLGFGARVFAGRDSANQGDVLVALRALSHYPTLMATFERAGIRSPAMYAAAARRAERLSELDDEKAFLALMQFQGVVALIARMGAVESIGLERVEALLTAAVAVPLSADGQYGSKMALWLRRELLAGFGDDGAEAAMLHALSGPPPGEGGEPIVWEGERYRVDLSRSELERLHRIRDRQNALPLDVPLDLAVLSETLAEPGTTVAADAAVDRLHAVLDRLPAESPDADLEPVSAAVRALPTPRDLINRTLKDLPKGGRDADRVRRAASRLSEATEMLLATTLASLTYAVSLGDPDSTTLIGGDVSRRHELGVHVKRAGSHQISPWTLPRRRAEQGVPWQVQGSLLGLDVALAPLQLRRLSVEGPESAPTLVATDRETFARSVAFVDPRQLRDADLDLLAASIARGRERVAQLTTFTATALAAEINLDGWRRRALVWNLAHAPADTAALFALSELAVAGGAKVEQLDAWGVAQTALSGCLCVRVIAPGAWRLLTGRPYLGVISTAVPDLHFQVAMMLKERALPARLAPVVLRAAVQDYVDRVRPLDPDDWLGLARGAHVVTSDRMADYVASAAAADGPLRPVEEEQADAR